MKKLFGVMVLASFGAACGSTLPSGPDALQTPTSQDGTVRSLARRPGKTPLPPSCSVVAPIEGIEIVVLNEGKGSLTLRAEAVINTSDSLTPCFVPTWSVSPKNRGVYLATGWDPQVATLYAPAGRYTVQAALDSQKIVGSLSVVMQ
jgi:hypothetical protein